MKIKILGTLTIKKKTKMILVLIVEPVRFRAGMTVFVSAVCIWEHPWPHPWPQHYTKKNRISVRFEHSAKDRKMSAWGLGYEAALRIFHSVPIFWFKKIKKKHNFLLIVMQPTAQGLLLSVINTHNEPWGNDPFKFNYNVHQIFLTRNVL